MNDTIPPELAIRYKAELERIMRKSEDERRDELLQAVTEIRVNTSHLIERMQKHEEDDRRQFQQVNQSIGGTLTIKHVVTAAAIAAAISGAVYFIITIAQAVKP